MKIKNLKANELNEADGTLEVYDKNNTITIVGNNYYISNKPNIFYKIYRTDKVKYTDILNVKVFDKYVYQLRREDNNNSEIYVSLTWWQNLKFKIMNHKSIDMLFKTLLLLIKKFIKILSK